MELKKVNIHWGAGERFTTGQEAVIAAAEPFYTHTAQERKNTDLKPKNKGEVDITFQPLRLYRSQEPAVCVILPNPASSGVAPPIFTPEIPKKPRYEHDNLLHRRRRTLKPKLPREEVGAACRQAPDGHVTQENRFL